jgi:predicted CXXCH cytochrome family protein
MQVFSQMTPCGQGHRLTAQFRKIFLIPAAVAGLVLAFGPLIRAQEIDSVVTEGGRRPFTVADEISDKAERKDFEELYRKKDPQQQAELSEAFLAHYPDSPVLAQVYEIAAKAQIQLGGYDKALKYAKESLRLYPENPLLIVPVADVQAKLGLMEEAQQNARSALEYLKQFARPQAVARNKWPRLRGQLMSSCYFVMGRSQLMEALNRTGSEERTELLKQSLASLDKAEELNPEDAEVSYLAGLSYMALGRHAPAAAKLVRAYASNDKAISPLALEKLKALYDVSADDSKLSFEAYLEKLRAQNSSNPAKPRPSKAEGHPEMSGYAGSQACRSCHSETYENWSHTGMARMFRPYESQNIIGDFAHDDVFYTEDDVTLKRDGQLGVVPGGNRRLFARMVMDHGRPCFQIRQPDGKWKLYRVDYTIGSKWEQAYATRLPNGEIHVFPIQYNALRHSWVNFWKIIDVAGSERSNPENWETFDISTNYKANCAVCHTSQLRNTEGGGFAAQGLEFMEPGIDCEMCHGPSAHHVASMKQGKLYSKPPIEPPVDFTKITSQQFVEICSQCHMQSAIREPGPQGELNYSRTSADFFMHYLNRPYDEFSNKAFYRDGRFRQTTFIVESLMRSKCYRQGHASCGSCHDPHPAHFGANKTSLKYVSDPNRMCTQCHFQLKTQVQTVQHTHHAFNSKGSLCVNCHMPRIMDSMLFWARTHRIDDIPDPRMTLRFGQESSPNACLLCHTDKDARWVETGLLAGKAKQ